MRQELFRSIAGYLPEDRGFFLTFLPDPSFLLRVFKIPRTFIIHLSFIDPKKDPPKFDLNEAMKFYIRPSKSNLKRNDLSNTTKLRIDLSQGTLDVEGSEGFVREIYQEFKERMNGNGSRTRKKGVESASNKEAPKSSKSNGKKRLRSIGSLNLEPEGRPSLREVYHSYKKLTRNEKFLVYLVYLKDTLEVKKVTGDHIYTCMKAVGDKVPQTLKQILNNSKNKTGWFEIRDGTLELTQRGRTYHQKDLEAKKKKG